MGMFNCVKYVDTCKECGTLMTSRDFQTKYCERPLSMETIELWECYEFSGYCPKCHHVHDYEVDAEVERTYNIKKLDVELVKHESLKSIRQRIFDEFDMET